MAPKLQAFPLASLLALAISALTISLAGCSAPHTSEKSTTRPSPTKTVTPPPLTKALAADLLKSYYARLAADDVKSACGLLTDQLRAQLAASRGPGASCEDAIRFAHDSSQSILSNIKDASYDLTQIRLQGADQAVIPASAVHYPNDKGRPVGGQAVITRVNGTLLISQLT